MTAALPWALLVALLVHGGAHVAIAGALAHRRDRRGRYDWKRALAALLLPPLAAFWGWRRGMKRRVIVWSVGLAVYALGVAVASF